MSALEDGLATVRAIAPMRAGMPVELGPGRTGAGIDLVGKLFRIIDGILRIRLGVTEFSTDPRCILRIARSTASDEVTLGDGTAIDSGTTVGELHLWNEQLPRIPYTGPGIAWARTMRRRIEYSLALLAREVPRRRELAELKGFRARIAFAGDEHRRAQVARVAASYGFELVACRTKPPARWQDLLETILVAGLFCAFNPWGLNRRHMRRRRYEIWISRRVLLDRYGDKAADERPGTA